MVFGKHLSWCHEGGPTKHRIDHIGRSESRRTAAGHRRTPPYTAGRRRTAAGRPGRLQDSAGRPPDTAGVEYTYGTPMSVLPSFAERKRVWVFRRCTLSHRGMDISFAGDDSLARGLPLPFDELLQRAKVLG